MTNKLVGHIQKEYLPPYNTGGYLNYKVKWVYHFLIISIEAKEKGSHTTSGMFPTDYM